MRQRLPADAPGPLNSFDLGRQIHPGDEFGLGLPVPGCVPVDAPEPASGDTGTAGDAPEAGGTAGETPPDGGPATDTAATGRAAKKERR